MERQLWERGCHSWKHYLDEPTQFSFTSCSTLQSWIERSEDAVHERNHQFFAKRLKTKNAWRAWPEFRDSMVCLDIETDGGQSGDSVTMVGLYDGSEFTCFVKGDNLESFRDKISHYSVIVTFFGSGFDLPMLQKRFPGMQFDHIHIDLCPALRSVGLRGGLKSIERQMGIARDESTQGLSGYDAVRLWRRYTQLHDEQALELLIRYNREDVVNLVPLADMAYERLKLATMAISSH
jgi:hypothetical protein